MRNFITSKQVELIQAARNTVAELEEKLEALENDLDDRYGENYHDRSTARKDAENMRLELNNAVGCLSNFSTHMDRCNGYAVDVWIATSAK